jgi:hypothetical protein
LGLHLTEYGDRRRNRERWVARRGGTEVVCNIQGWPADPDTRTERVRARLVVHEAGQTRRYETHWTFRTYDGPQLRALLASEPRLQLLATYCFDADISRPTEFDGRYLDHILILKRRA